MSQAKKIQQAEELHLSGQLTDAELEAMRIKIAVEEKFSRLQASGQESLAAKLAQEVQGKIDKLLAEAEKAKVTEVQRSELP